MNDCRWVIPDRLKRGILIVDDEPDIVDLIRHELSDEGYTNIFTASNGLEALSILARSSDDIYLVLLDIRMPELDGIELVHHMSNDHKQQVGVIFVTAYSDTYREKMSFESELVHTMGYIVKESSMFPRLMSEVNRVLEAIHEKRVSSQMLPASEVRSQLLRIENELATLKDSLAREKSLPMQLGMELLKAIIIALGLLAIYAFGIGDFLRKIITGK